MSINDVKKIFLINDSVEDTHGDVEYFETLEYTAKQTNE